MAGYRKAGPVCGSQDGFDLWTLPLAQAPSPGPVCAFTIEAILAEAAATGKHTSARAAHRKRRRHAPPLKPDPTTMAAINTELGTTVNFDKLADFEGGQMLHGYIPGHVHGHKHDGGHVGGRSGVTIATGFDLGQQSVDALNTTYGLSAALQAKYRPYCNKTKQDAVDVLEALPLTISKAEADETDMRVQRYFLLSAKASWDGTGNATRKFVELSPAQQTVLLSRTYHQGTGMPNTAVAHTFYTAAQKGDWEAAERALRNYVTRPAWYVHRVRSEANYLAEEKKAQLGAANGHPAAASSHSSAAPSRRRLP